MNTIKLLHTLSNLYCVLPDSFYLSNYHSLPRCLHNVKHPTRIFFYCVSPNSTISDNNCLFINFLPCLLASNIYRRWQDIIFRSSPIYLIFLSSLFTIALLTYHCIDLHVLLLMSVHLPSYGPRHSIHPFHLTLVYLLYECMYTNACKHIHIPAANIFLKLNKPIIHFSLLSLL